MLFFYITQDLSFADRVNIMSTPVKRMMFHAVREMMLLRNDVMFAFHVPQDASCA
jgi:hypothetical protein